MLLLNNPSQIIMLAKIIFFISVIVAIFIVVLLANFKSSPPHIKYHSLSISLYIQPPYSQYQHQPKFLHSNTKALIFHNNLTVGGKNTSQVVGRAQGFLLPAKQIKSMFSFMNIMHLTFDKPRYNGSIAIESRTRRCSNVEEYAVLGGTGYYAFAQGFAAIVHLNRQLMYTDAKYLINLKLRVPVH